MQNSLSRKILVLAIIILFNISYFSVVNANVKKVVISGEITNTYTYQLDNEFRTGDKDIEIIMGTVLSPEDDRKYEVPDWVHRGDILCFDCKGGGGRWARPGKSNDHACLYLGKGYVDKEKWPWEFTLDPNGEDWFIESLGCHNRTTDTTINTSRPNGVQMNNYTFYFRWAKNFRFGCVVNEWLCRLPDEKIENAMTFALDTFNRTFINYHKYDNETGMWSYGNYQVFFEPPHFGVKHSSPYAVWGWGPMKNRIHPTADKWFCAEFVWAAYKNCDDPFNFKGSGIDIDKNEWRNLDPRENIFLQLWYGSLRWITPQEILWDENVLLSPILYTLTVEVNGSGNVSKKPDQCTYLEDDTVELTAIPDTGWIFSHWSGNLTGSNNPVVITIPDDNLIINAHFVLTEHEQL
jgi:hypothetical protein